MKNTDVPIVDMLTLRKDLYFLMSLLLADKEVAKNPDVIVWTSAFHENEMRRLLLWAAVAMRGLLDLPDQKDDFHKQHCGEYLIDTESTDKTALTFRQACNSIIHAKEILPYLVPEHESDTMSKRVYINRITVRGRYRGKTTRAQIDIVKLVQIADIIMNHFEGNDHGNL